MAPAWDIERLHTWWRTAPEPQVFAATRGDQLVAAVLAESSSHTGAPPRSSRILEAVHAPSGAAAIEALLSHAAQHALERGAETMWLLTLGAPLLEGHARQFTPQDQAAQPRVALETFGKPHPTSVLKSLTPWRLTFADLELFYSSAHNVGVT